MIKALAPVETGPVTTELHAADLAAAIARLCELQEAMLDGIRQLGLQLARAGVVDQRAHLTVVEPIQEPVAAPTVVPLRRDGEPTFRRDGEDWEIGFAGERFRLRDSKGLSYIAHLLECPGDDVHALDLIAARERPGARPGGAWSGDAGELIDDRARAEYGRRLSELSEELDQARAFNDPERAARLREEMDCIAREIETTVGLGGRPRRACSDAERARQSVCKAIKAARERIAGHSPALARHLGDTIETGTFCSYTPAAGARAGWRR